MVMQKKSGRHYKACKKIRSISKIVMQERKVAVKQF
jgi:hypothetical protein